MANTVTERSQRALRTAQPALAGDEWPALFLLNVPVLGSGRRVEGAVEGAMEFRILGPIEVVSERGTLAVAGRIQQALLANLLLHANQVVSADRLTEAVWGEDPPLSAPHMLHVYVSRLRKELAGKGGDRDILVTRPPGYLVRVQPPDRLDLDRFEALRRDGRRALEAGDPHAAASALHEALDLWRGPPLSGFENEAFAQPEIARLEELRLMTLEDRIEADLALGRHADAVAELRTLTAPHPLRERLWMLLALGLYRSGRQGDALSALQTARQTLAEEIGVDPGPALVDLEAKILRQDPAIEWSPRAEPAPPPLAPRPPSRIRMGLRPQRRTLFLSIVAALVLIAAGAFGIIAFPRSSPTIRPALVLRQINPAPQDGIEDLLPRSIPAPTGGRGIAVSGGTIAVIAPGRVALIDRSTGEISNSITLPFTPTKIVGAAGSFFVAGPAGSDRGEVALVDLTPRPSLVWHQPFAGSPTDLVVGLGFAWVLDAPAGQLLRFGLVDGRVADAIPEQGVTAMALGGGSVWLADPTDRKLVQLDPRLKPHPLLRLRFVPGDLVFLDGLLWVMDMDPHANLVWPIDPATGQLLPSIKVGNGPHELATTPSSIWVGNSESVTRVLGSSTPPTALNITGLPGPLIGIAADVASPAHRPTVWLLIARPAPPSSASPTS